MPSRAWEAELVRRALAGERSALSELVNYLLPVVHARVARSLLLVRPLAGQDLREDVAEFIQDIFEMLFRHQAALLARWHTEGASLQNYVGLVAQRHMLSALKSRYHRLRANISGPQALDGAADPQPSPEARVAARQLLRRLLEQLRAQLSPRGVEMLDLLFFSRQTPTQIGETTGLSVGAVNQWKHRISELARELIGHIDPQFKGLELSTLLAMVSP